MAHRARWVLKYEKGLVDILHENNVAHYRTQNGWRTDGWRKIVRDFNDKYPDAKFSKIQIQEHEAQLKRDYKLIKSILTRDGVSWDQNGSMIRTTDEIWDEIIEETPKARKYQSKSFPLLESLELLFEGDIAEGEHNLTSSIPQPAVVASVDERDNNISTLPHISGRPCGMVIASIDEGENNISVLQRTPELGPQGLDNLDLLQNDNEEVLERPQCDADPKAQRTDEPAHSSSCVEPQKDKRNKKRKIPDIQHTMEAYLDFRMKQARMKGQATKDGERFAISRCIKALHAMVDVSDEIKVLAADVFKDAANREIFLSFEPRLRTLWLKKEVKRLIS